MSSKDIKSPINFIKNNTSKHIPLEKSGDFVCKVFPITYYHLSMTDNDILKDLLLDKIVADAKNLEIP